MAGEIARRLRREMTDAELKLWDELRKRQAGGYRFRRQHPIGRFIVDFVCLSHRLVIEVDGATHGSDEEIERDRIRTAWLESEGYRVLRVENTDVYENVDGVIETILHVLSRLAPRHPHPVASARLAKSRADAPSSPSRGRDKERCCFDQIATPDTGETKCST